MHAWRALTPAYLLCCLLLGGASAAGIWGNMLLQLLALPIIAAAALRTPGTPVPEPGRQLIALLTMMVAVIAVQLVPLPPSIWTSVPGRGDIARGFAVLGQDPPWLTLSLGPYRTISSALWLLPPIAIALAMLRLRAFSTSWTAAAIVAVTAISVAIGGLQVAGGERSPWYFYAITNYGASVGFFSNANHLATLLVATLPFLAALYLNAADKGRSVQRNSALLLVLAGAAGTILVGLAINGSLAGLALAVPVIAACALMIISRGSKRALPKWQLLLIPVLVCASALALLSAPIGRNFISDEGQASQNIRATSFSRSASAALEYLPAGSGLGTFQDVYRGREDPNDVQRVFMNHVHSDYIELALETGVIGLLVLALFLLWWIRRTLAIWRSRERDHFAAAGSVASAAILVHSMVDYPLRTVAIAAIFAVSLAFMSEPRSARRARPRKNTSNNEDGELKARHLSAD